VCKLKDTLRYNDSVDERRNDSIEKPEKFFSDIHLMLDFQESKLNRFTTGILEYAAYPLLDSVIDVYKENTAY
jgi:hypothetical protein